jgi:iron complex transport system ATP-binding protein
MKESEEIFVECRSVSIGYHDRSQASFVVKNDLSLRAFGGEIVALIGQNGIGKSTLLKTIAGFQPSLSGELLIHSRPATSYRSDELAREMSFVSTEIVRVANLTVRELVGLGRYPYSNWFGQLDEEDHRIVEEAIRQVGLSGYGEKPINRISDGERQRAMIARALAQDTKIIVLDEPTAFLDISNKYEIVHILHLLANEQGKCIIFSTHDLTTALSMADRIWLMLNDKVVDGIPEEIASEGYFESLFASNPHLFFDAEKGDFRVRKESRGIVVLNATGKEQFYATKALERLGFEVVNSSGPSDIRIRQRTLATSITVFYTEDGWIINHGGHATRTGSLELLCREIRKINPPRQS